MITFTDISLILIKTLLRLIINLTMDNGNFEELLKEKFVDTDDIQELIKLGYRESRDILDLIKQTQEAKDLPNLLRLIPLKIGQLTRMFLYLKQKQPRQKTEKAKITTKRTITEAYASGSPASRENLTAFKRCDNGGGSKKQTYSSKKPSTFQIVFLKKEDAEYHLPTDTDMANSVLVTCSSDEFSAKVQKVLRVMILKVFFWFSSHLFFFFLFFFRQWKTK